MHDLRDQLLAQSGQRLHADDQADARHAGDDAEQFARTSPPRGG